MVFFIFFSPSSQANELGGHLETRKVRVVGDVNPNTTAVDANGMTSTPRCIPNVPGVSYPEGSQCSLATVSGTLTAPPTINLAPNYKRPALPAGNQGEIVAGPFSSKTESVVAQKFSGRMDFAALKTLAVNQGVPALIYDRALQNFRTQLSKGTTSRGCFIAMDMTSAPGKSWMLCFNPKPSVEAVNTDAGSGFGTPCKGAFHNRYACPRFFGNKNESCLSPGGNFLTGISDSAIQNGRIFTPMVGLDSGVNTNTQARNIGIHTLSDPSGNSLEGKIDPRVGSRGCFVWPHGFSQYPLKDLSSVAPGGALAIYSYPSKEDLQKFMANGNPPYWNSLCRAQMDYAAWIDEADSEATLTKILERSEESAMKDMLSEPEAQDIPVEQ